MTIKERLAKKKTMEVTRTDQRMNIKERTWRGADILYSLDTCRQGKQQRLPFHLQPSGAARPASHSTQRASLTSAARWARRIDERLPSSHRRRAGGYLQRQRETGNKRRPERLARGREMTLPRGLSRSGARVSRTEGGGAQRLAHFAGSREGLMDGRWREVASGGW
jgi:hypothetical protein